LMGVFPVSLMRLPLLSNQGNCVRFPCGLI
jgi:hypothetical protein